MDSKWTFLIHPRLHLSRYSTIRIVQRICYCEVRRISQLTIPNKNWNGFDLSYEWRRKDKVQVSEQRSCMRFRFRKSLGRRGVKPAERFTSLELQLSTFIANKRIHFSACTMPPLIIHFGIVRNFFSIFSSSFSPFHFFLFFSFIIRPFRLKMEAVSSI